MPAQGEAAYSPKRYRCKPCGEDYDPLEEANGLSGSEFTTGAKGVGRTAREVSARSLEEENRPKEMVCGSEAAVLRSEEWTYTYGTTNLTTVMPKNDPNSISLALLKMTDDQGRIAEYRLDLAGRMHE